MIQSKTGIWVKLVPYAGSGGILPDPIGGSVDITFGFSTAYASGVESGILKYLAVMASEAEKQFNDLELVVIGHTPEQAANVISEEIIEMTGWIDVGQFQVN